MKKVMYICPNCFKIHETLKVWRNSYECDIYKDGTIIKSCEEDTEVLRLDFPCDHTAESYSIEDVEVYIDQNAKTITILSEFKEFEDEIREANPEFKDYRFIFE